MDGDGVQAAIIEAAVLMAEPLPNGVEVYVSDPSSIPSQFLKSPTVTVVLLCQPDNSFNNHQEPHQSLDLHLLSHPPYLKSSLRSTKPSFV